LGGSHIGALRRRNGTTQYATLEIEAQPGDQFYLMSDGFKDQFGGAHDRKLGRKRLAEMLAEVGPRTAQERLADIQRFFLLWKGANEQVDDVILVGITH
jgi:serine phosphatase RsbU (regulator of sigma subunit)